MSWHYQLSNWIKNWGKEAWLNWPNKVGCFESEWPYHWSAMHGADHSVLMHSAISTGHDLVPANVPRHAQHYLYFQHFINLTLVGIVWILRHKSKSNFYTIYLRQLFLMILLFYYSFFSWSRAWKPAFWFSHRWRADQDAAWSVFDDQRDLCCAFHNYYLTIIFLFHLLDAMTRF